MADNLYVQFIACLIAGLAGLCTVLKVLFDSVFAEWDVIAEVCAVLRNPSRLGRSFVADWEWERTLRSAGAPERADQRFSHWS